MLWVFLSRHNHAASCRIFGKTVRLASSATGHATVKLSSHTSTHFELISPILMAEMVPDIISAMVIEEISADTQNCFLLINTPPILLSYLL